MIHWLERPDLAASTRVVGGLRMRQQRLGAWRSGRRFRRGRLRRVGGGRPPIGDEGAGQVASQGFQGGEGAVVGALATGAVAEVGAEAAFLFLELGLGDAGRAGAVVAADVKPELAIDAAGGFEVPGSVDEFFDENSFVRVLGLVGFEEPGSESFVFGLQRGCVCDGAGVHLVEKVLPFPSYHTVASDLGFGSTELV